MSVDKEITIIIKDGMLQEVLSTDKDIKVKLIDLDVQHTETLKLLEDEVDCARTKYYNILR